MEFKKKTIIWEDNNEPPKDYIWAKKDGKFYEYDYVTRSWVESKSISGESEGSGSGSGVDINTILDNISIKDDLLTKLQAIDYTNQGEDGVLTDLTFDDVFNDYNDFIKSCLYREEPPAIASIGFPSNYTLTFYGGGTVELKKIVASSLSYSIFIINENNNIEIFAMKEGSGGPM